MHLFLWTMLVDDAEVTRPTQSSGRGEMSSGLNSRAGHEDGQVVEQRLPHLRRQWSDRRRGRMLGTEGGVADKAEEAPCNKKSSEHAPDEELIKPPGPGDLSAGIWFTIVSISSVLKVVGRCSMLFFL